LEEFFAREAFGEVQGGEGVDGGGANEFVGLIVFDEGVDGGQAAIAHGGEDLGQAFAGGVAEVAVRDVAGSADHLDDGSIGAGFAELGK
jgi:hypothetical protein